MECSRTTPTTTSCSHVSQPSVLIRQTFNNCSNVSKPPMSTILPLLELWPFIFAMRTCVSHQRKKNGTWHTPTQRQAKHKQKHKRTLRCQNVHNSQAAEPRPLPWHTLYDWLHGAWPGTAWWCHHSQGRPEVQAATQPIFKFNRTHPWERKKKDYKRRHALSLESMSTKPITGHFLCCATTSKELWSHVHCSDQDWKVTVQNSYMWRFIRSSRCLLRVSGTCGSRMERAASRGENPTENSTTKVWQSHKKEHIQKTRIYSETHKATMSAIKGLVLEHTYHTKQMSRSVFNEESMKTVKRGRVDNTAIIIKLTTNGTATYPNIVSQDRSTKPELKDIKRNKLAESSQSLSPVHQCLTALLLQLHIWSTNK